MQNEWIRQIEELREERDKLKVTLADRDHSLQVIGETVAQLNKQNKELCQELVEREREVGRLREQYSDLIMCVGNKYLGESRHDTAKRYIISAEKVTDSTAKAALAGKGE